MALLYLRGLGGGCEGRALKEMQSNDWGSRLEIPVGSSLPEECHHSALSVTVCTDAPVSISRAVIKLFQICLVDKSQSVCSTPSCVEQVWTWNTGRKEGPGLGSTSGENWLESPITWKDIPTQTIRAEVSQSSGPFEGRSC